MGYERDESYGKPPRWGREYGKHFPRDTCGASRHVRLIADEILRNPKSEVRRMLIDAGYEPDHWASSLESTVLSLWRLRAENWRRDPEREQRKLEAGIGRALKRLQTTDREG